MMSPFYMKRKRHPEVAGSCASIITANPAGFLDLNHCLISFNWHPPVASPFPRSTGKNAKIEMSMARLEAGTALRVTDPGRLKTGGGVIDS
jgi:hypothetical protein